MTPHFLSYRDLASRLQQRRPAGGRLVACVDGAGASGKSTVAAGLMATCQDIQVVHMDDFYRPAADRYRGAVGERPVAADFDLDRLQAEVLLPFRQGLATRYRIYDWGLDRLSLHWVQVTQPILVVEGVYSSSAALSAFHDVSIWVECPRDLRLARGLARDGEGARSRWENDWMPGEDLYIQQQGPRERAELVCGGSGVNARVVFGSSIPPGCSWNHGRDVAELTTGRT
jgi:uridine kinase